MLRFVVDAGVGTKVESLLQEMGHRVTSVRDLNPHMRDPEILQLALSQQAIVVTMDKDFGDLIYKDLQPHYGVLLLRLEDATGVERTKIVRWIVTTHGAELPGRFAVFQNDRLRISG